MSFTSNFSRLILALGIILFSSNILFSEVYASNNVDSYTFVPNRGSSVITVIDSRTDEIVRRIGVGSVPHQVVVSTELDKLAVTNSADDTISIIDLNTF